MSVSVGGGHKPGRLAGVAALGVRASLCYCSLHVRAYSALANWLVFVVFIQSDTPEGHYIGGGGIAMCCKKKTKLKCEMSTGEAG